MPAGRRRLLLAIILILPAIPGLRGFAIPPAKFQPTSSVFAYSALRRATEPRLWRFFPAEQSCSALVPRRAPKAALCGARGAQERSSASSPPSDGGGGLSSGSAQCKTHRMSRRRTVLARVVAGAGVLLFGSNAREAPAETGVGAREAALVNPAQAQGESMVSWAESQEGEIMRRRNKLGTKTAVLELEACGGGYCVEFSVDGKGPFRAVVDTGSPFFTVSGGCGGGWGCFTGEGSYSGYEPTFEVYAGQQGRVVWKRGEISFPKATGTARALVGGFEEEGGGLRLTFGVLSTRLVARPGGVFMGLIKERQSDIRPTFLGQTEITAFQLDLASRKKTLSLCFEGALLPPLSPQAVPLVDLRPFGDPVFHYSALAKAVTCAGLPIKSDRPIYVIFDTGTTGLSLSRDLYEEAFASTRQPSTPALSKGKSPWSDVRVTFTTNDGRVQELRAKNPISLPVDVPWRDFQDKYSLVVVGLSFLEGSVLTIDTTTSQLEIAQVNVPPEKPGTIDPKNCEQSYRFGEAERKLCKLDA
ncbi:hypothetical protein T484DRAFT_2137563 [Baffinella frigidus]|nr:hypothetical protein T484DRAFT_2137563 [Cryptophyta sp. CCMP2293]